MEKGREGLLTGVYAVVHMAADLSCAFLMYAYVIGKGQWYLWLLAYNFCAFAMQMPIGLIADGLDRNSQAAAGGCIGVLAGLGLGAAGYPGAASVIAGLGNACFHAGGGIDVLNTSHGKMTPLGIFVAPGAMGIFLGGILGRRGPGPALGISFLMVLSAAIIWVVSDRQGLWHSSGNVPFSLEMAASGHSSSWLPAACFLGTVILRSYSGMVQSFPWKEHVAGSAWLLTGAVVLGKMAGGILGDRLGPREAALRSMCAAGAGFICLRFPVPGILAVLFWNMSMPLTLWAAARAFPGARGFSFGLLTFGLFLGFCPVYLEGNCVQPGSAGVWAAPSSPVGMAFMALVSLFILRWGLERVK